MQESEKQNSTTENYASVPPNRELLEYMGRIINSGDLYGPEHQLTVKSADQCFVLLSTLLDVVGRIRLTMTEDRKKIAGYNVNMTNPFINTLAARLADLAAEGFSFVRGLTREEFGGFVFMMFTGVYNPGAGGMQQVLTELGITHIEPHEIANRRSITD